MSMPAFSNTPVWEKVVGLVGFTLIIATILFLLGSAFSLGSEPPDIDIKVTKRTTLSNGYLVTVIVQNRGDITAENLEIEGRLDLADGGEERVSATVDYLAPRASREIGFYFRQDPSTRELSFYPLSFQKP